MIEIDPLSFPPVEPDTFDLIVVGTGLPESVIAAAASASGKSVLHLDPNPFYGSSFASLKLSEITSILTGSSSLPPSSWLASSTCPELDHEIINVTARVLHSNVEIETCSTDVLEEADRKFNIDLSGPRVLFCADKAINLMIESGASHYVEFKSIDASFIANDNGELWRVPDSRASIFKDNSLSYMEKNHLMKFLKMVQNHLSRLPNDREDVVISEEDLDIPFSEFLNRRKLPSKIESIIWHTVRLASVEEDIRRDCKDWPKTKDAIDSLILLLSSVGRFKNAQGPFIYPIYGQGELPQAFCRRAAVKGCINILRMPVVSLLADKNNWSCKGVRLATGQDIFCHKLLLSPSVTISTSSGSASAKANILNHKVKGTVARGICLVRGSLMPDISNLLVVYPPQSLFPKQNSTVRALQISDTSLSAACPAMFVLYLSSWCDDAIAGKELLKAAINTILTVGLDDHGNQRSTLLWRAVYTQELTEAQFDPVTISPMADGNLNYDSILDDCKKLFQSMYPGQELFSQSTSENSNGGC